MKRLLIILDNEEHKKLKKAKGKKTWHEFIMTLVNQILLK